MGLIIEQKLEEYKDILLGKKLGYGDYRTVYECSLNKNYVVKVESDANEFANMREWKVWEEVQYTPFEKWFAPCEMISENGLILIQQKVTHKIDELPDKVPYFFTDVKPENWGFIGKNFVCCDYGSLSYSRTWSEKKMRSPKWQDLFTDQPVK